MHLSRLIFIASKQLHGNFGIAENRHNGNWLLVAKLESYLCSFKMVIELETPRKALADHNAYRAIRPRGWQNTRELCLHHRL